MTMSEPISPSRTALPPSQSAGRVLTHHTMHSILQHGQFGYKDERIDLSNIPHYFKNMIVEQSIAKLKDYEPVIVSARSDFKCSILDTKIVANEKKRLQDVYKCGFLSDPKELYCPLGDPILDTELLLYKRLNIDPSTVYKKSSQQFDEYKKDAFFKTGAKHQQKFRDVPKNHTNGFKYIKEKLAKSNLTVNSVKFGVPFSTVCEPDSRIHTYDVKDISPDTNAVVKVNWNNLEIDMDRQGYFGNLLLRHERATSAQNTDRCGQDQRNRDIFQDRDSLKANEDRRKTTTENKTLNLPIYKHSQIKLTSKQIEGVLGIQSVNQTAATTEKFFTTRDNFYEQRQRLTHLLQDDLTRLHMERKTSFERKVKAFELSKYEKSIDGINDMRQKAAEERRKEKIEILLAHPWYNELIKKVVVMNGVRRKVTQYESVLLGRLKRIIADQISFNKAVFVQLMRVLPTREFVKDEVQRIIRFVKQHENIAERDYLEAVELAGHPISSSMVEKHTVQ
ncbi:hypothetical protein BDV3_001252 [Batrachochytrium dendrobatidis]|nr:hypothetical protein O5D80_005717 [Batrachochytrium dendrobatidis]KAK5671520.1 hypothetical protein QVD99_002224 [Batrachochytrium dendrobatidis]